MNIETITVEQTWPIRNEILRPGLPLKSCQFEEDGLPSATHFGSVVQQQLTGIVSVYQINPAHELEGSGWQFRAMATLENVRGHGHGRALIEAMERFLIGQQADLSWCNARVTASGFYQKLGYITVGEQFEVPGVGSHWFMQKRLSL